MKFLDTNAILKEIPKEKFAISSITLQELENIKTSANKDAEIKWQARQVLRKLDSGEVDYEVIVFKEKMLRPIMRAGLSATNDAMIISSALACPRVTEFVTNDLACKTIAKMFFKNVTSVGDNNKEEYKGYKEVILTDEQMCDFYSDLTINRFNALINEYVIIRDSNSNCVDLYCWTGTEYRRLKTHSFFSEYFGEVKAMKGDIYQKIATDSLVNNQLTVLRGPAGTGKAQPNSTLIPTKNGYVKLGDIKIGDYVLDRFGNETKVLAVYPQGLKENFKITFSDGRESFCNDEHLWSCYTSKGNFKNFTVKEMMQTGLRTQRGDWRYKIPKTKAIEYIHKDFEIDPYIIGVFLGDGCCKEAPLTLSSADIELVNEIARLLEATPIKNSKNGYSWNFALPENKKYISKAGRAVSRYQTKEYFKNFQDNLLCYAHEKSIPECYKYGSIEQRLSLIQGLMDTDGSIDNEIKGRARFFSTSIKLVKDLQEICWSLGFSATINIDKRENKYINTNGTGYSLSISCPKEEKPLLFRLSRKKNIAINYSNNNINSVYNNNLTVKKIEKMPHLEEMTCILVDNPEHLYLTEQFIVTHNTFLGLGYLFSQLETGKIDKIIIFCNPVATKSAARLGFYKGTKNEKLLDSQIGNLLSSKLGDEFEVEKLINEGKLVLMAASDSRGYDTSGMNAGVFIDEAQNSTIELMKLFLQRIGEDSIVVLCGDDRAQVDLSDYEGNNNGLRRMCEVFKGESYFGTSYLKNCHRSKIAQKAEEL